MQPRNLLVVEKRETKEDVGQINFSVDCNIECLETDLKGAYLISWLA